VSSLKYELIGWKVRYLSLPLLKLFKVVSYVCISIFFFFNLLKCRRNLAWTDQPQFLILFINRTSKGLKKSQNLLRVLTNFEFFYLHFSKSFWLLLKSRSFILIRKNCFSNNLERHSKFKWDYWMPVKWQTSCDKLLCCWSKHAKLWSWEFWQKMFSQQENKINLRSLST